ncbi:MAG: hypothetical protein ACK5JD_07425, partial [Mangrovibacterium sp.]
FTAPATEALTISTYCFPNTSPRIGTVHLSWYKLEEGNKATAWSPAPEDVAAYTDTAKTTAISTAAADATTKANTAQTAAQTYAAGLVSALNAAKQDAIVNGNTLIVGGYLNTAFIEAKTINSTHINFDNATGNNVNLTGAITANTGAIGDFSINAGGIVNTSGTSYVICRNSAATKDARIGTNVFPATAGTSGIAYFNNEDNNIVDIYAIYARAANAGMGRGWAGCFVGDVKVTGRLDAATCIPDSQKIALADSSSYNYMPSGYYLFVGDQKTGNRHYYLPPASSYKAGEVIRIVCWNDNDAYLHPRGTDTTNGYTDAQKYVTLNSALHNVHLRSNGSNQWMIVGGQIAAF